MHSWPSLAKKNGIFLMQQIIVICVGAEVAKPHGRGGQLSMEKAGLAVCPSEPISLGLDEGSQDSLLQT